MDLPKGIEAVASICATQAAMMMIGMATVFFFERPQPLSISTCVFEGVGGSKVAVATGARAPIVVKKIVVAQLVVAELFRRVF